MQLRCSIIERYSASVAEEVLLARDDSSYRCYILILCVDPGYMWLLQSDIVFSWLEYVCVTRPTTNILQLCPCIQTRICNNHDSSNSSSNDVTMTDDITFNAIFD